ncbi:MAG: thioesterase, partial [Chloroflexi bacterium]|nr:thioesterase [Chloroflexota bacterium]
LAAVFEVMMLHVDQTQGRVAAMPPEILANFAAIQTSHQVLSIPTQVGNSVRKLKQQGG